MSAPSGFRLFPARLDLEAQQALLATVMDRISTAPVARYQTPGGQAMSVAMTSLGSLGWVSDRGGYRYDSAHPATGQPWPPIPQVLLDLWSDLADPKVPPDACLVNLYRGSARMGLHQDRDEADLTFPVLSISLGDTAVRRNDPTASVRLASGDVCILSGEARLAFHGVDRIVAGSSRLIPGGGRLNLTLRRAAPA